MSLNVQIEAELIGKSSQGGVAKLDNSDDRGVTITVRTRDGRMETNPQHDYKTYVAYAVVDYDEFLAFADAVRASR
jgi:hypothetical protein